MRVFKTTYKDRKGRTRQATTWYVEFRDHLDTVPPAAGLREQGRVGRVGPQPGEAGRLPQGERRADRPGPDPVPDGLASADAGETGRHRPAGRGARCCRQAPGGPPGRLRQGSRGKGEHAPFTSRSSPSEPGVSSRAAASGSTPTCPPARCRSTCTSCAQDTDEERGISAQTFNFYLQAVKQFCRWMVKDRRASELPLAHLEPLNVQTDRRHDRRELTEEELPRLLAATRTSDRVCRGLTGRDRYHLYATACGTGFRASGPGSP